MFITINYPYLKATLNILRFHFQASVTRNSSSIETVLAQIGSGA